MEETQNSPTERTEGEWYCHDCEETLEILYDERDDEETPVVCGTCGGTDTERIVADGGRDEFDAGMYHTEYQCENCSDWFGVYFEDPTETFEATCPTCGAHYEELYV